MIEVLTWLSILFGSGDRLIKQPSQYEICNKGLEQVEFDYAFEILIGCTKIDGRYVSSYKRLKWLYDEGSRLYNPNNDIRKKGGLND